MAPQVMLTTDFTDGTEVAAQEVILSAAKNPARCGQRFLGHAPGRVTSFNRTEKGRSVTSVVDRSPPCRNAASSVDSI
jgi:hypothetical protein